MELWSPWQTEARRSGGYAAKPAGEEAVKTDERWRDVYGPGIRSGGPEWSGAAVLGHVQRGSEVWMDLCPFAGGADCALPHWFPVGDRDPLIVVADKRLWCALCSGECVGGHEQLDRFVRSLELSFRDVELGDCEADAFARHVWYLLRKEAAVGGRSTPPPAMDSTFPEALRRLWIARRTVPSRGRVWDEARSAGLCTYFV